MKLNQVISAESLNEDNLGEVLDSLLMVLNLKLVKTVEINHGDPSKDSYSVVRDTDQIFKAEKTDSYTEYRSLERELAFSPRRLED